MKKILCVTILIGIFACKPRSFHDSSNVKNQLLTRPPQFVLISFDGAGEVKVWKAWRELSNRAQMKGKFHFTSFLSGVYFLSQQNKNIYHPPGLPQGSSDIGFNYSTPADGVSSVEEYMSQMIDQINKAYSEGQELGSHLNGHFCGGRANGWNTSAWQTEFGEFSKLVFNAKINNNNKVPSVNFKKSEVIGVRTPCLEGNPSVYLPVLKEKNFRYDASGIGASNLWPHRDSVTQIWKMNLASLPMYGGGPQDRTVSMDYNFMVNQAESENAKRGTTVAPIGSSVSDPTLAAAFGNQMYKTYIKYFEGNYFGNRAPVHIGHHHTKWNFGEYEKALRKFVTNVCVLPEVRCATYSELVRFLEKNISSIDAWESGKFDKLKHNSEFFSQMMALKDDSDPTSIALSREEN